MGSELEVILGELVLIEVRIGSRFVGLESGISQDSLGLFVGVALGLKFEFEFHSYPHYHCQLS